MENKWSLLYYVTNVYVLHKTRAYFSICSLYSHDFYFFVCIASDYVDIYKKSRYNVGKPKEKDKFIFIYNKWYQFDQCSLLVIFQQNILIWRYDILVFIDEEV